MDTYPTSRVGEVEEVNYNINIVQCSMYHNLGSYMDAYPTCVDVS